MTSLLLGILCSVPQSYASDKWESGDMIGTVATVLSDGLLLNNVYLKIPTSSLKQGDSYYEHEMSKYTKTNETIFIYTDTTGFKANGWIAGSIRYKDMHSSAKAAKDKPDTGVSTSNDKNQVRAFRVFGSLDTLNFDRDIKGPIVVGAGTKAEGKMGK